MTEPVQICRGFTDEQWRMLRTRLDDGDVSAWTCALPDCSTLPDDRGKQVVVPGFASSLVLWEKPAKPIASSGPCMFQDDGKCIKPTTTDQFREFLRRPAFRGAFDDDNVARSFVNGVRNGIFHEAETRGWLIWREEPPGQILALEDGRHALNRTEFYDALKAEFDGYIAELRRDPSNSDLRSRFKRKMTDIVKES